MLPWNDSSGSHSGLSLGLNDVNASGTPTVAGTVPGVASLTTYSSCSATGLKVVGGAITCLPQRLLARSQRAGRAAPALAARCPGQPSPMAPTPAPDRIRGRP